MLGVGRIAAVTVRLARRNAVAALMGIELMLNAVNINLVAFWRYVEPQGLDGLMFVIFSVTVAAVEDMERGSVMRGMGHFGVIVVLENDGEFQVATFRNDGQYLDEEYETHVGWGHSGMSDALTFASERGALAFTRVDGLDARFDPAFQTLLAEKEAREEACEKRNTEVEEDAFSDLPHGDAHRS